ncbi:serine hydrolase [Brevibacillus sp. DP1.3A]|uniref:serine hydrolase domain-containing protein n=1 Tax=Brevibacillus sp. DP1.3A TaxID=2738867 RepID=UPI00156BCC2F|nr:serine hydrolase domain-containing protein [Brevibacillus sp. DP1.3A]UED72190.1 beta-lactamase family protein [Brevibacillus sp. DP1.3A]
MNMLSHACLNALEDSGTPGVAMAVLETETDVERYTFGLLGKNGDTPVRSTTLFQAASLSKPVTAWGVMKLVETGRLYLEDTVYEGLTVRHLLSHTGGLASVRDLGIRPHEEGGGLLTDVRSAHPVGEFWYTNAGYSLLQILIEKVSGKCFADYMCEEILEPLGMKHSSFNLGSDQLVDDAARGHDYLEQQVPLLWHVQQAAAGLYTTLDDLIRFAQANLNGGGGVLQPDMVALMHNRVERPIPYGLGYHILTLPKSSRLVWHSGHNRGYRTWIGLLPKLQKALVVLTNSDHGQSVIAEVVCKWLLQIIGDVPDGAKKTLDLLPRTRYQRYKHDMFSLQR